MARETQWQKNSDQALTRQLRPLLERAYGTLPPNEAWLTQLVHVIRDEMDSAEDAVPLTAWALGDEPELTAEGTTALESEATGPVLVQLVAELARIVLLDEPTASHILRHLQDHFEAEQGWTATQVQAPIRIALTGQLEGPPLPSVMALLGRERCMRRIATTLR